ncbi:RICIN domain-containing protein [Acrocarpospora corrugata]|uniref:RICIN domain-containing protein n=1 Tax=Acrocarpospora corrugata TaxID=35763 RepID=UPI0012D2FCC1
MASVITLVATVAAIPANAATYYLFHNLNTVECLDSNSGGSAYANPCNAGNNFQLYAYVSTTWGYLIQSNATGRCLDSNASGLAYTNPCSSGNAYQNWQRVNWSGSNFQLQNIATGRCLQANTSSAISTAPCNSGNTFQRWWN